MINKCNHLKEGSYRKMCDICADENLCYFCVDDHECELWKKEFVSKFIKATMNPARYKDVRDMFSFIEDLMSKSYQQGLKETRSHYYDLVKKEQLREIHKEWHKARQEDGMTFEDACDWMEEYLGGWCEGCINNDGRIHTCKHFR